MLRLLPFAAVLLLVGCTLGAPYVSPTPTLPNFGAQTAPTITPVVQQPLFTPVGTPIPGPTVITENMITVTPSPQPIPTLPPLNLPSGDDENDSLAAQFIRGIILPIWNFILDLTVGTMVSLWNLTGDEGGLLAQAVCCLLPGTLFFAFIFQRILVERGRRGRRD